MIISRLITAVILAAVLTGTLSARETAAEKNYSNLRRTTGQSVRRQPSHLADSDRRNFNLGSKFTIAVMDAAYLGSDENTVKAVVIDLVYLIDALENQPQSIVLQQTLKSVVRGNFNAVEVTSEIKNARQSYSNKLSGEQKWHFDTGSSVTHLVFSAYTIDDAAMKIDLSKIRELVKIAPQATSDEIIVPLKNLLSYISGAVFAEKDRTAILKDSIGLVEAINIQTESTKKIKN